MNLIAHFREYLDRGDKLCLMPISRLLVEEHIIDPLPGYVFCPPASVDLASLRLVWDPASAWKQGERQLGWAKAAATQVSKDEFTAGAVLAFPVDFIDWPTFLSGDHDYHLDVIRQSSEQAEHLMDLVRLEYCRMDLPETLPGRVSQLETATSFSCGLYYTLDDHESYLIAGQVIPVARMLGLGLDCGSGMLLPLIVPGETGNLARHGLSLFTEALEATYLSSKFVQCCVVLEFLASPDEYETMSKAKTKIGAHIAKDKASYHAFCEEIQSLYKNYREKIVHGGVTFEKLVPSRSERARIFRTLQHYIGATLTDMIANAAMPWTDFQAYRTQRLQKLGVK